MAYDGIVVAATVSELKRKLLGGSIVKVAQPEKDELLFTVKKNREQMKLSISANASVPSVTVKEDERLSPLSAPSFCMALRKHIGGGRIVGIEQGESFERLITFTVEHLDDMGDRNEKYLICELMGKHSNIILAGHDMTVVDSIKHVTFMTSSLREVFPGRRYFLPKTRHSGLGRVMDEEIMWRAGVDSAIPFGELTDDQKNRIVKERERLFEDVRLERFEPNIIYSGRRPVEFAAVRLRSLEAQGLRAEYYGSMSEVVGRFYEKRETESRIKARSEDIRQLLKSLSERTARKLELQEKQLSDAEDREKYRIYGELINVYGYSLKGGEKELVCENFYDGGRILRIPLDEHKSASQNAVRYFDRYQKLKRTAEALKVQIKENSDTLYHLDSIKESLVMSLNEADLREIRAEMADAGYIRKTEKPGGAKGRVRREEKRSEPLHFVSSDGVDIYVGRNNAQNEELAFKLAGPDDWWFHARKIPGSHVIAKTGRKELPDATMLEAAALAAHYSRAGLEGGASLIEVDYVKRKELRKVPGAPKGFVIYHTNYSVFIEPKAEI